ncbi:protein-glutamate O-methyltransferase [bacterium]|nr:protein-glutamate O-methyltransferase [bacterium]
MKSNTKEKEHSSQISEKVSDSDFRKVAELVKSLAGINLTDGKQELVSARLAKRLRALHLNSIGEYLIFVREQKSQDELVTMLDAISTNLTSFWRESDHFDYVVEKALPKMVQKGQTTIRAWSAGCSTGEEPYGLGMLIHGNLPNPGRFDFKILATDLSTKVLDTAKRGRYGEDRVKSIPPELLNKYMTREKHDGAFIYSVESVIRNLISFNRLNLMESWPMKGPFDLIFCRNVMIYFDKPTQTKLIHRYFDLLRSGGTLFVGHSESLAGIQNPFKYIRPTIYEKP